ncbi:MAG: YdcF family protein [Candidatus Nomurabacteria bacterium]|nr:YdcF family protein [Candidatus Nomurabacteria bacterium]
MAPIVLISGSGSTKNMPGLQDGEAVRMAEYVKEHGVSNESILIEDKARSTGDNALFSKELLEKNNIQPKSIILITKPYMERRVYSTFNKQWPGPEYSVTSKNISYEDYSKKFPDKDNFINLMVGDLQRIKEYPKMGFQIEQDIPEEVWQAGQELIKMGYNKFLLK